MIHLEFVDRAVSPQTVPVVCMHCDTPTCAEVCPGRRDQANCGRRRANSPQTALRGLQQLCFGVSLRRAENEQRLSN